MWLDLLRWMSERVGTKGSDTQKATARAASVARAQKKARPASP
jgi:hypothetical protein